MKSKFDHSGSSFDAFLQEEGIREEVETVAMKRVSAWQIEQAMREQRKTKQSHGERASHQPVPVGSPARPTKRFGVSGDNRACGEGAH